MGRTFKSNLFRLLVLAFYILIIWTYFSVQNPFKAAVNFFSYKFNIYSITFIVFNILLGFAMGMGKLMRERKNSGLWRLRFSLIAFACIPLLFLSVGSYMYSTFRGIEVIRELFLYVGIFDMAITESGKISAITVRLLSSYIYQICFGYLLTRCIYKK